MQYRFESPQPGGAKPASSGGKKPAKPPRKAKKVRKRHPLLRALFYLFAVGAMASLFLATYVVLYGINFVGGERAIVLEDYKFQQDKTTIVYAYTDAKKTKAVEIARLHGEENRIWVPLTNIPDDMKNAFVALEDKRFWSHNGVDWFRTLSSATAYKMSQGGSTLTQQLIKNLTNEKDVTVVRKVTEILTALNLERNYSKADVLETYLNTVYMGNGCYGIQTASETYFGKDVAELTLAECAALSTITNAPTTYDPLVNPDNVKKRQLVCLNEMLAQGLIGQEEYDKAKDEKLVYTNTKGYKPKTETSAPAGSDQITSTFVDYVIEDVKKGLMEQQNYTATQAMDAIYYKGLKIYTTMDAAAQKAAEKVYLEKAGVPSNDAKQGVQGSMTMMDYEGRIVAMVGQLGKKTGSRSLNRATTLRQPGSTFKPLGAYSPAIDNNLIYWSKLYLDYAFNMGSATGMFPHNYDGRLGSNKYVTVQYALRESLNTVPARIIMYDLGLEKSYNWLTKNLHFTTLSADVDRYSLSALSIGGGENGVSTLEMCAAYATIGNLGKYYKPYSYYKVVQTKEDEEIVLLQSKSEAEQAMKPETAELTRRILQTINRSPYKLDATTNKYESFMKTGTTTGYKDRWFALGFPKYVAVMWYGFDTPKQTTLASYNPAGWLGFSTFKAISSAFPKDGTKFANTGNLVQKSYCTQTGLLATSACPSKGTGWYIKSALPGTCTAHSAAGNAADSIADAADSIAGAAIDAAGAIAGAIADALPH
ncbi:MAG: transglycosylase domain-containing protein [Oscillospiraceae bacterium]|jgi:penicillin-binding protein 1A|nr:transglycosylase domain-containing protein [Oscillospiraceae bacterium]